MFQIVLTWRHALRGSKWNDAAQLRRHVLRGSKWNDLRQRVRVAHDGVHRYARRALDGRQLPADGAGLWSLGDELGLEELKQRRLFVEALGAVQLLQ